MPDIVMGSQTLTWISALVSLAIGLAVKDMMTTFVSGFLFSLNKSFREGDHVKIDGKEATIIKVGYRQTVFQCTEGEMITWMYVYNDRIKHLNLEKVIKKGKQHAQIESLEQQKTE